MPEYDYLVVGAGLSGAVFTNEALKRGKRCLVLEKRGHVGGNVYCDEVEGIKVHIYGAHIFHTDNRKVWSYVKGLSEFNNFVNSPLACFEGRLYNLPFNMNTFYQLWGVKTPAEARAMIESQIVDYHRPPENLEEQALSLVGRDIYEKLIRGYTEKQWNRPCRELPAFIIKRLPLRFTFDNNYFTSPYQGIPLEGYTAMVEKLLAGSPGPAPEAAEVRLNADFLADKERYMRLASKVVYTGMIDAFFDYRYGGLEYRSLRFEHSVLDEENHQGVAVMNYTGLERPYTRIIEHKHFVFGGQPKTVVTREYPQDWRPGLEPYYPVNDEKNGSLYTRYREEARKEDKVIFLGRLARYTYCDMDQAITAALEAARAELGEKSG